MLNRYALADAASRTARRLGGAILIAVLSVPQAIRAQPPYDRQNPYDPDLEASSLRIVPVFQAGTTDQQYMVFCYHPDRIRDGVARLATVIESMTITSA